MASKENSTSSLIVPLPPPAKRRRFTIYTKCLFCQVDRNEILRKAKLSSYDTLRKALDLRKDEISDRLNEEFPNFEKHDVFWHSTCYSSYTSVQNISYATGIHNQVNSRSADKESCRVSRASIGTSIDWSKCFICGNKTYKKCLEMHNICTFDACESVRQAAESKGDERMLNALFSVNNDLIAAEAKYHKTCFSSYVSKSNLKHRGYVEKEGETVYDAAFQELAVEVGEGINQQKKKKD